MLERPLSCATTVGGWALIFGRKGDPSWSSMILCLLSCSLGLCCPAARGGRFGTFPHMARLRNGIKRWVSDFLRDVFSWSPPPRNIYLISCNLPRSCAAARVRRPPIAGGTGLGCCPSDNVGHRRSMDFRQGRTSRPWDCYVRPLLPSLVLVQVGGGGRIMTASC